MRKPLGLSLGAALALLVAVPGAFANCPQHYTTLHESLNAVPITTGMEAQITEVSAPVVYDETMRTLEAPIVDVTAEPMLMDATIEAPAHHNGELFTVESPILDTTVETPFVETRFETPIVDTTLIETPVVQTRLEAPLVHTGSMVCPTRTIDSAVVAPVIDVRDRMQVGPIITPAFPARCPTVQHVPVQVVRPIVQTGVMCCP